jgi:mannose-6-phosphate isomerase-like protein (cupin superfamily)
MSRPLVVVEAGQGHRVGNVEFLARTEDTPFFNLAIIVLEPGQGVESHVHEGEDDSFLVLEGTLSLVTGEADTSTQAGPGTFVLVPAGTAHAIHNSGEADVRFLNVHAPGGFDRRIGLGRRRSVGAAPARP